MRPPEGVFAKRGSQITFPKDSLAVPLKTYRLLYTQSASGKIYKCVGSRALPAGGCFLPVA